MNKQLLQKALNRADAIQKLYRKLHIYRTLQDKEKEEQIMNDLKFVLEMEKEVYTEFINKDIEEYCRDLIRRNPRISFSNLSNILYGKLDYSPEARVYQRLIYLDEQRAYYPEFTTKVHNCNKAEDYLLETSIIKVLNFFVNNLAINRFYNSTFVFENIRYNLAYLYPVIEKDFLKGNIPKEMSYPSLTQINFAMCDDDTFFYHVELMGETCLNEYLSFLTQKLEDDINYFNSEEFKKRMPIDEMYLRFLFFLLGDHKLIDDWIFYLQPYKDFHPNLKKLIDVVLNDVVADTERFFGNVPEEQTESDGVTR